MDKVINLSNFPKDKIYVLLDKATRVKIINNATKILKCKNYFELSIWINKNFKSKFNGGDIRYWIEGKRLDKRTNKIHPKFMPLWLVCNLSKLNNKSVNSLQNNVIAYRSGGKGLIINKPIVPIKITPELDSVVIHLFADGSAGDFTPSYMQKNKDSFNNFIRKLENCFGTFDKSFYFTDVRNQIRFPKAITDVLSSYYDIKSYSTYDSEIPPLIMNRKDCGYKLASIISFIVDEGFVRDVIALYSANKKLLSQIRQLVLDCNYRCSNIQFNKKANSYLFTLKNKDLFRFYYDVRKLSKNFSTCNLSFKEEDVRFILEVMKNKKPKNNRLTKEKVISILKNDDSSARQISKLTKYAYCTVLHNLQDLMKNGKVIRFRRDNRTYIWKLNGSIKKK